MLVLIILSAFVAALIGLFIGKFSKNLMVGVVYVKIVMIVFMAVPLLSYLLGANGLILTLCYFVPSNATFEGIMSLAGGTEQIITKDILILTAHCLVWFLLYLAIAEWKKKNKVKQNIISTLMNVGTKIWNTMTPTFRYLRYAAYLFQKRTLMP